MRFLSFLFALGCVTAAFAKPDAGMFNKVMLEGMDSEIKKDSDSFKKPSRGPASVGPSKQEVILDHKKSINKTEKRDKQLGQPSW